MHCAQELVVHGRKVNEARAELNDEEEEEDVESSKGLAKLSEMLEACTKAYAEADLVDLDFYKEADYSRSTAEGEKNAVKVGR